METVLMLTGNRVTFLVSLLLVLRNTRFLLHGGIILTFYSGSEFLVRQRHLARWRLALVTNYNGRHVAYWPIFDRFFDSVLSAARKHAHLLAQVQHLAALLYVG